MGCWFWTIYRYSHPWSFKWQGLLGLYSYFSYTDPLGYISDTTPVFGMLVLDMVDTRSRYLRASSVFGFASVDPYLFARETYFQQRLDMIYDGAPPVEHYYK